MHGLRAIRIGDKAVTVRKCSAIEREREREIGEGSGEFKEILRKCQDSGRMKIKRKPVMKNIKYLPFWWFGTQVTFC